MYKIIESYIKMNKDDNIHKIEALKRYDIRTLTLVDPNYRKASLLKIKISYGGPEGPKVLANKTGTYWFYDFYFHILRKLLLMIFLYG